MSKLIEYEISLRDSVRTNNHLVIKRGEKIKVKENQGRLIIEDIEI